MWSVLGSLVAPRERRASFYTFDTTPLEAARRTAGRGPTTTWSGPLVRAGEDCRTLQHVISCTSGRTGDRHEILKEAP
jgi:hypothetical protein